MAASPVWAEKFKANGWTVNVDTGNGGKISGDVRGPSCKTLHLDLYTTRWGHAVVQVENVSQSRKFFSGVAAVYGRGPSPQVSSVSATCQD